VNICDDLRVYHTHSLHSSQYYSQLLEENIRKVKLSTPDYRNMDPEQAVLDFKERRAKYMQVYEPVDDEDGPHVKIINSKQFHVNSIRGYLPLKVVHFVMNLHTQPRTVFLTRHGQSEYNLLGKIGGDSGLTPAGLEYARRLAVFAKEKIAQDNNDAPKDGEEKKAPIPCRLWTSTLRRTKETAQFIEHATLQHTWDNGDTGAWVQFRPMKRRNLDELYAGTCDGMTYKEIEKVYPEEFERRQNDKLTYRYPRGKFGKKLLVIDMISILECRLTVAGLWILRLTSHGSLYFWCFFQGNRTWMSLFDWNH
jgi:broad specificity phosphatase PhoE